MMPGLAFVAAAAFLVFLLSLSARDDNGEDLPAASMRNQNRLGVTDALRPAELVLRIFSPKDREFIRLTRSPRLQRLYREERRRVALHWVRLMSREMSTIMRRHRLNSRHSQNVNVAAEAKLFGQYMELRFLCAGLVFLIQLFGPHALVDLASYAGELRGRLGKSMLDATASNHVAASGDVVAR
jgi:hypothetical protein